MKADTKFCIYTLLSPAGARVVTRMAVYDFEQEELLSPAGARVVTDYKKLINGVLAGLLSPAGARVVTLRAIS